MTKKSQRKGRPPKLGKDAIYLTIKFRRDQFRKINRIAGPAPGGRPDVIRELLDLGLKVATARRARC